MVGASGVFTDSGTFTTTATTDGNGIASAAAFIANDMVGSYEVTATIDSFSATAGFWLTNTGVTFLPICFHDYCTGPTVDDFSNPASGWPIAETSYWSYGYLNGEYRLYAKQGRAFGAVSRGDRSTGRFIMEVDARKASTANGSLGIQLYPTGPRQ